MSACFEISTRRPSGASLETRLALPRRGGGEDRGASYLLSLWSSLARKPGWALRNQDKKRTKSTSARGRTGERGPWVPWPLSRQFSLQTQGSQHGRKDPAPRPGQAHPPPWNPLLAFSGLFSASLLNCGVHTPALCDLPFFPGILR